MRGFIEKTQPLGRALMLPIAVLPAAALLLRLGQPDLLNLPFVAAAGNAIFANLGVLFALGVAVGLAKENHGAAGLAGLVGYLIATEGVKVLIAVPPTIGQGMAKDAADAAVAAWKTKELSRLSVPIGIISGLIAGWLYNRYKDIKLPTYLAFFAGRRFVPIAAGFAALVVAAVFGYAWPVLTHGMDVLSAAVLGSGRIGLFAYGVLNRLLIVTGLHHIINNMAWFLIGNYHGTTGDLNRFFAGDPSAGAFMSGFFPVMMFGLPAACLAMYTTAKTERKKATAGLLMSLALTSFLTGVTEPIEFSFMFLAPALFAVHAVLTGLAMVTMDVLNVKLGFGFSAGLFDYVLNLNKSTNPFMLLPVGLAYAALYYVLFRWTIVKLDLATPGREAEGEAVTAAAPGAGVAGYAPTTSDTRATRFISALGGAGNLQSVDSCITRLRLVVNEPARVDDAALKSLGSSGTMRVGDKGVQVILGPIADQVAGEIRSEMQQGGGRRAENGVKQAPSVAPSPKPTPSAAPTATLPKAASSVTPTPTPTKAARAEGSGARPAAVLTPHVENGKLPTRDQLVAALGGANVLQKVEVGAGRVLLTVTPDAKIDESALRSLGVRGVGRPKPTSVHLLHADPDGLASVLGK